MKISYPVRVLGTGAYVPGQPVSSASLDAQHQRPAGATERLGGVRQRHFAAPHETSTFMAGAALQQALVAAGLAATDLDLLLATSVLPEQPMPTNAVLVHRALGLNPKAACFDINGSCLGFLHALETASAGIAMGRYRHAAIVSSEIASKGLERTSPETSALFGDGAAAVVLGPASPADGSAVFGFGFETHSRGAELCQIVAGGTRYNSVTPPPSPDDYLFRMDGPGVFRLAAEVFPGFLDRLLQAADCPRTAIDCIIPHQASYLGLRFLTQRLGLDAGRVVQILPTHGNQVSASIPSTLHAAVQSGQLQRGQLGLLLGTAAGISLGAALLRY
ncbi:MAG: 3-oxoacyl-[acyl-carrier-protein] synthase III C-terminal domain-containing protein [Janthinobacterium lividum]